jgi:enterochelin esterase family protein
MPDSPVVHSDRRVTFGILAPKANEVELVDGILGAVLGGPKAMKKGEDGVWSITVGPLDPGIYDYGFSIDGSTRLVDPANTQVIERAWGPTSFFEVPGDTPNVASARDVPRGALHIHHYDSKAVGKTRRVRVYTPAGYEKSGNTTYPVLYLFHGSGGIDSQWTTVGRANFILDGVIADGKAKPMIVVMTNGHVPQPKGVGRGRTANEGFEQDLIGDVMPLVESLYRIKPGRENRAIAGLSMGGGQSMQIGLSHLDLFSSVASFSGAVRDLSTIEAMSAADLNEKLDLLWIGCGKDDFLFEANNNLDKLLTEKKVQHVYRVSEGGHTWPVWRLYLSELTPLLFQD